VAASPRLRDCGHMCFAAGIVSRNKRLVIPNRNGLLFPGKANGSHLRSRTLRPGRPRGHAGTHEEAQWEMRPLDIFRRGRSGFDAGDVQRRWR
jgi:hypothetical protein